MYGRPLLLALLLHAPLALGQATTLERAQAAYDDLDFEGAAKLFKTALREPGTREERLSAWKGLGLASAFVGDRRGAQKAFEMLLLIDPDAQVSAGLGPKVTRPFDAAKKSARGRMPDWRIQRDEQTGAVRAELKDAPRLVEAVKLYVQPEGGELRVEQAPATKPVEISAAPQVPVRAWAEALDDAGGVLFEGGTKEAPLQLRATARPEAVEVAVEDARKESWDEGVEAEVSSSGTRWPLWVGGAVAVVGGGVAAYFLTRPQTLSLPPADRTGRLP